MGLLIKKNVYLCLSAQSDPFSNNSIQFNDKFKNKESDAYKKYKFHNDQPNKLKKISMKIHYQFFFQRTSLVVEKPREVSTHS